MNEYVNQFRQVSPDKEGEIVNKLIGKKNILEVGYYAGQISVRLAEIAENLTCVDLPNKFFSPDLSDHIKINSISNIRFEIVEDVIQYVKDNHANFDAIYIDESHGEIDNLLTWIEKKTNVRLTVVYNDHATDSIKSADLYVADKTEVTTTPKKRSPKQSKTTSK
jgi:predicted O-methyltransferase YrrM